MATDPLHKKYPALAPTLDSPFEKLFTLYSGGMAMAFPDPVKVYECDRCGALVREQKIQVHTNFHGKRDRWME